MEHKQTGYLFLADITGYEKYINEVELEHASNVVAELLGLIMSKVAPPLQFSSYTGDGVLAFAPDGTIQRGETLLEMTEAAYLAFRDRLETISRTNTCDCNACRAVPNLDLKFFVHYGEFLTKPDGQGRTDLIGLDANLLRDRALKDQLDGIKEPYVLFTHNSLARADFWPDNLVNNQGKYENMGEIKTARLDLKPIYAELVAERQDRVSPEEADISLSHEFAAAPAALWEWFNNPELRTQWTDLRSWSVMTRPQGRMGIGAKNHCSHGVGEIIETVLDWQPYQSFTVEDREGKLIMHQTFEFEPLPDAGGTRLQWYVKFIDSNSIMRSVLTSITAAIYRRDLRKLDRLVKNS